LTYATFRRNDHFTETEQHPGVKAVTNPTLINETVYPDGGYVAGVRHYGKEFAVHYIAGEVRVYATARHTFAQRWQRAATTKAVTEFAAGRIAALGPEFHAAHAALYAEELA